MSDNGMAAVHMVLSEVEAGKAWETDAMVTQTQTRSSDDRATSKHDV